MILTGEHLSTLRKSCPSNTLSKSLTWTDLESNLGFCGERPATNSLAMVWLELFDVPNYIWRLSSYRAVNTPSGL